MDKNDMPSEVREAWKILAEISDMLAAVSQWADSQADEKIMQLHNNWQTLCSQTETARSMEFYNSSQNILKECELFRTDIINSARTFAEKVQSRGPVISELAGDNKETKALTEELLKLWNEAELPRLVFLYEKTAELESRIVDMIEFAMEPVEAAG